MEKVKRFLVESWRAKLVSLFIAISIWYLIRSHLEGDQREFPVYRGRRPRCPCAASVARASRSLLTAR
jgi:hypothetical protein